MSENDFRGWLHSIGLLPGAIVPGNPRWTRCPTENKPNGKPGAFKLSADCTIGWAKDHSVHPETLTWKADGDRREQLPFDPAALERAHADAARRRAEERRRGVLASQAAREFYARCEPLRDGHPYLASHGLGMAGCMGLKVDREGWLVVPAYRNGNLMTVQRIAPGPVEDGITKRFWPGASPKGASFTIERRSASVTVLCEGLATGLALFVACPTVRVVVAFTSGNLKEMEMPRLGMVCVAADNDWKTAERIGTNPGIVAAQEAAQALGVGVAIPEGMQGSDFCDLREELLSERLTAFYADPYARGREGDIRRGVDAEIAAAIMRAACLPGSRR